jgi:hypothetical protein
MEPRTHALPSVEWRIVKPEPRRDDTSDRHGLHLAELLDFRPDQGIIRLHEQRVVILSAAAMGLLRKELIDTLGLETARRVAIRFGFADEYDDAVNFRERANWADPIEGIRAGAVLHTLEGIVRADVREIEHDGATGRFEEEVVWHDSYVAEQHVHHSGRRLSLSAGPWSGTRAASPARALARRSIFARCRAWDRERSNVSPSGVTQRVGAQSST